MVDLCGNVTVIQININIIILDNFHCLRSYYSTTFREQVLQPLGLPPAERYPYFGWQPRQLITSAWELPRRLKCSLVTIECVTASNVSYLGQDKPQIEMH